MLRRRSPPGKRLPRFSGPTAPWPASARPPVGSRRLEAPGRRRRAWRRSSRRRRPAPPVGGRPSARGREAGRPVAPTASYPPGGPGGRGRERARQGSTGSPARSARAIAISSAGSNPRQRHRNPAAGNRHDHPMALPLGQRIPHRGGRETGDRQAPSVLEPVDHASRYPLECGRRDSQVDGGRAGLDHRRRRVERSPARGRRARSRARTARRTRAQRGGAIIAVSAPTARRPMAETLGARSSPRMRSSPSKYSREHTGGTTRGE